MFSKIIDPTIDAFDAKTNAYIGSMQFDLTPASETALLNLVNFGHKPSKLMLQDVQVLQPYDGYIPAAPYVKHSRRGVLRAVFVDQSVGECVPMEIQFTYDILVRDLPYKDRQYAQSAELSNIVIEEVRKSA